MPKRYFDKFPVVMYNNYAVRDITVSAALVNKYVNLPYSYNSFDLDENQRPDTVSNAYYSDPFMSWMVFYANNTIDPYYDWYLPEEDFINFLTKKYGAVNTTIKTILEFRTNWFDDNRELSPSQFLSMFGEFSHPHSRYWTTNYDDDGRLISYTRKVSNEVVNTNKLAKIRITDDVFSPGDLIDIRTALNSTAIGVAQVESASPGYVFLKNIIGSIDTGNILVKDGTSVNASITKSSPIFDLTSDVWTRTNISPEEYIYWTPHTVFDSEREKNDEKKTIKLVDPTMAFKIANTIEDELSGRKL